MNQQQAKYSVERVNTLLSRKLEELRKEYTVQAQPLSDAEIVELIVTGKVGIKADFKRASSHYGFQVSDLFDLSKHTWSQHMRDGYVEAEAALKAQAAKVKDEIMLGDNAQALALLREFAGE
jgi:hypothetical protein